jgi:protein-tyrosine phosphatase
MHGVKVGSGPLAHLSRVLPRHLLGRLGQARDGVSEHGAGSASRVSDSRAVRAEMIDLHIHVLPAVDDGPSSLEGSRAMLERARDLGFTRVVATPHLNGPLTDRYAATVAAAHEALQSDAGQLGIEVERGYEVQLTPDLPTRLDRGEPIFLGRGGAVLVELPFAGWPLHAEQTLFGIQAAGFRPVLAHPERYAEIHRVPHRALALAERGIGLQVTIASLVGLFGARTRQLAEDLLRRDVIDVLATDAHSAGRRFDAVADGLDRARSLIGQERLEQLLVANPAALLDGTALPHPIPAMAVHDEGDGWRETIRRTARRFWRETKSKSQ